MPQRILGLDIGSYSIKGVVLEDSFRGFKVEDTKEVKIPAGTPETRQERVVAALKELQFPGKIDACVGALPSEMTTARFITLPYSDPKKIAQTISGELSDSLPFDLDDSVYGHEVVRKVDDNTTVNLAAVAPKSKVEERLKLLQEAEIDPKFLAVDGLQIFNLYTHFLKTDASKAEAPGQASPESSTFVGATPGGPPPGRLLVDIGHERTLVLAATDTGIQYVRVIKAGGKAITQALAQGLNVDEERAEDLKHWDGFIGSSRHPAPSEDAQRMSELVASGMHELFRELRRTLQTIRSEKRVVVTRLDLLGGGARIRNLANRLADELNMPVAVGVAVEQIVERSVDQGRRGAFALALALALRAAGDEPVSTIDLRTGEFQFAGQMMHLREQIPVFAGAVAVMIVLLGLNAFVAYHQAVKWEHEVDRQFCEITKATVGREICEPKEAISAMRQPASEFGNVKLPERSALNIAAELSQRIPGEVTVDIEEIDITPERAKITGETATFDAVDSIVSEYSKDKCYSDIKKGKLRKKPDSDKVEFQLAMEMGCS
ncbi:MAG: pilus assembly protein PilM [Myxococcota bacterium]